MTDKQLLFDRFAHFLRSLPDAEAIDDLTLTDEQALTQRADFFLQNRGYIVELKLLSTDTRHRMEPILEPHRSRPEFALLSRHTLDTKLELLPDGDELRNRLHTAITESVEGLIKKANRQIRHTRRSFAVETAGSILVILNDDVAQLSPPIVAKRAAQALQKRRTGGAGLRFTEIDTVWIVSEAHYVQVTDRSRAVPDVIFPTFSLNAKSIAEFVRTLSPAWAAFNDKGFAEFGQEYLEKFRFQRRRK